MVSRSIRVLWLYQVVVKQHGEIPPCINGLLNCQVQHWNHWKHRSKLICLLNIYNRFKINFLKYNGGLAMQYRSNPIGSMMHRENLICTLTITNTMYPSHYMDKFLLLYHLLPHIIKQLVHSPLTVHTKFTHSTFSYVVLQYIHSNARGII